MPKVPIIQDATALKRELSRVFADVRKGKLDPKAGSTLGYLAQIIVAVLAAERETSEGRGPTALDLLAAVLNRDRQEAGQPADNCGYRKRPQQASGDPTPGDGSQSIQ